MTATKLAAAITGRTELELLDEALQVALIKEYGMRRAGDMRYQYTHKSQEAQRAADAYKAMVANRAIP